MEKKLIFILIVSLLVFEAAGKKSQSKLQSHLSSGKFRSSQDKSDNHDAVLADIKPPHAKFHHDARVHNNEKSDQTPLQNDKQDPAIIDPVFDIQMQQNAPFPPGNYTIMGVASGLCLNVAGGGDNAGTNVDIAICTQTPNQVWYLNLDYGNVYWIQPQTGGTMCLDVDGANSTPGTNVFEWPCNYNTNEQWQIVPAGNNSYNLIAVFAGGCLEVEGAATIWGSNVNYFTCNGGTNEQWIITPWVQPPPPFSSGNYTIMGVASGLCLDVAGGGDNVDIALCTQAPNQVWYLNLDYGNVYSVQPQTGGTMCLDVENEEGNVFEGPCNNGTSEQWQIVPAGNNSYYLVGVFSEDCLDVEGAARTLGANINYWICNGGTNQQWIITPWIQAPPPFPSGNYTIVGVASGLCLDVAGGGDNEGTNVDIAICTQTPNQVWYLNHDYGNVYWVQPQTGGTMCLDVENANPTPGTNVFEWPCNYGTSEQWQIEPAENNSYYLVGVFSGGCLEVEGAATIWGSNVNYFTCNGGTNEQWIITPWVQPPPPFPSGNYTIVGVASGLCLDVDVAGGEDNEGTNVDIATCTQTPNQVWYLNLDYGNVYWVQPQTGGTMCLDVDGSTTASSTPGATVVELPCNYGTSEQWQIVPAVNNSYNLISVFSEECLDVTGALTNPGTGINRWTCNGGTNQQWIITPWACPAGSFWVPEVSSCQPCNIKNCNSCEDNQGTVWCTSCLSGYSIEKGTGICVHSVAGWQNCGKGLFWNPTTSQCQNCSSVANCLDCVDGGGSKPFCTICSTGYVASANNGTCNVALG